MEVKSALALINSLIYKPGWSIVAEDHTNRFEGTVKLIISYPARQSEREDAAKGYPVEINPSATFPITVTDCEDDTELYRKIIGAIAQLEIHEAREFLRVHPTNWAPFHPHRVDGMKRWGSVEEDLRFGIG